MKKLIGKLKVFKVVLAAILVSLIAFLGVFSKDKGVWTNLVKDYQYGMDIEGSRELRFGLDSSEEEKYVYVDEEGNIKGEVWKDGSAITAEEENSDETDAEDGQADESTDEEVPYSKETKTIKVNSDDVLTKENFEEAKKIIQERFEKQEVSDYNIRIDDVTGELVVETVNDDDNIQLVENLINEQGKFKIVDYQNGLVLMDNSDIKNVSVVTSNDSSYKAYLQIEFNKEGSEKLREMSNKYVEIKNDETENTESDSENQEDATETDEETTKKYVSVVLDDTTMMTTYFGEEMTAGILQIEVGDETTDYDEFKEDYESAQSIATILNNKVIPVKYELETDNFVQSAIADSTINTIKIAVLSLIIIISLIFIIRYKKSGLIVSILNIGYIALLSIIIRYTNVIITINSLIAIAVVIGINYIFTYMILNSIRKSDEESNYSKTLKQFCLNIIPLSVVSIVFTLMTNTEINSIGMVMFWGIVINIIYNLIFTRTIVKK